MLLMFRAKNYRSIREEQTLSLVANSSDDSFAESVINKDGFGHGVLSAAVIYGANASGKSNVIRAIKDFVRAVQYSHESPKDRSKVRFFPKGEEPPESPFSFPPFALDAEFQNQPTEMEITFLHEFVRYDYGFICRDGEFVEEWLTGYPNAQPVYYFHRSPEFDRGYKFSRKMRGQNVRAAELTRSDSLFVSSASRDNHKFLGEIRNAIVTRITNVPPNYDPATYSLGQSFEESSELKNFALSLLQEADTGVCDFELRKIDSPVEMEDLKQFLKPEVIEKITEGMPSQITTLRLVHQSGDQGKSTIEWDSESRGTIRILALSGPLHWALSEGTTVIIDELEIAMHPLMARSLVSLFQSTKYNPHGAQLIFATHSASLLDSQIFRRDQVWFTEKDQSGGTQLYPLTEYSPRKNERIGKGYLEGRYGGIPFLGEFDF